MSEESRSQIVAQPDAHLTEAFYATKPTGWTRFMRVFLPWQAWRFVAINWKMLGIIRRSHRTPPPG